jgi:dienelactone hydrolase
MRQVLAIAIALFLSTTIARAAIKTQTVEYKAGDTTLKGFLAYDDATTDKRPAVIIVHEWWGLNDYVKRRAQDVARLGYVAFAADMFGDGTTTSDPKEPGHHPGSKKSDTKTDLAPAPESISG